MSAYEPSVPRAGGTERLAATLATLAPGTAGALSIHHLPAGSVPGGLAEHLHAEFEQELERGASYPQEQPMTRAGFEAYFLGHDLFVGVVHEGGLQGDAPGGLEDGRAGRAWGACVGGAYYVKPNYPGRSSHICNAGFLVVPRFRRIGVATALARSFVACAPRLGYTASVFNLVYASNTASVRLWERLGFEKVGRIPRAGRLRRREEDGGGEEYVDAWVVYKAFGSPEGAVSRASGPPSAVGKSP